MGIFDVFKKNNKKQVIKQYAPTMTGYNSILTPFGDNIYASDIVIQSVRCIANEFKKLEPRHLVEKDGKQIAETDSNISRLLTRPNEYMTISDFLEKISILLTINKNVFIYPAYYKNNAGEKIYTALYPLKPSNVAYLSADDGKLFLEMEFNNGYKATLPADEVIHWRKDYGFDDYFGGKITGGDDKVGFLAMLKRYDKITQGIANALEISCSINGVVRYNTYHGDEQLEASREKFEKDLRNNKSGILFTDLSTEYTNIPRDTKIVDSDTLKFFYDIILMNTGVSMPILKGEYTKSQKEAFYEHALEADIKSLGQAMSKVLFTDRQFSFGNRVVLYPNEINFMSMENKLDALRVGLPAGIFVKDEARALLGYPPLPNGQGQVIAQGYNSLLDENNNNKLKGEQNEEKE